MFGQAVFTQVQLVALTHAVHLSRAGVGFADVT